MKGGVDGLTIGQRQTVTFTIPASQICRSDYLMKQEPPTSDWLPYSCQPELSTINAAVIVLSRKALIDNYYQPSLNYFYSPKGSPDTGAGHVEQSHVRESLRTYISAIATLTTTSSPIMEVQASADKRPEPIDLSHHYSIATRNRVASNIKKFYKYFTIPGIGNLAGGLPNNNYFPFDTLEAAAALPERFTPTPNKPVDPPTAQLAATKLSNDVSSSRVVVPKASDNEDILRKIDLKTALQYGTAQGYPPLYSFLRQFTTENLHPNVPYKGGPEIILTCGSTDGFSKTLEALTNIWNEGKDPIADKEGLLVEEFCYMNAIGAARPRGLNIVPVAIDDEGMKVRGTGGLYHVLSTWDESRGKRPHLIYTVT